ncbi:response regulator transcription factor [Pigmentiphaga aceris]|uniref:Response regulator transcription factor n=1 Tax=Pigmentiphaga aceris TaxID=1940612 RepID=A0A5C0ASW0_9BURK|nr:response regulator transcription factor [Pigmentiphaga aceris]QEI04714.1 response regulator transcription factor [Pigmentiphaga aceris]
MVPVRTDSKLVMLVDDVPDNLKMLSDALDQAGYMVVVAIDGASAIERLDYVVPDIVLMDAVMPGMDGFETCRRLKAHRLGSHVPVVFMTGLTDPSDVVRGFQAGGVDYVTKPIETDVVLARLEAHLRTARMMSVAMDAIDAVANAVVVLDDAGRAVWRTGKARYWLSHYFGGDEAMSGLPPSVHAWVADCLRRPGGLGGGLTGEAPVFEATHGRHQLTLRLTASRKAAEYVLLLEERLLPADPSVTLAATYSLTTRELDVLQWVIKGKTNRDISDILGMSPRTVNKHLEHIFVKLGVETRAAATSLALTQMHAT